MSEQLPSGDHEPVEDENRRRHWDDLTPDEQSRIRWLLDIDPDDNLEDAISLYNRVIQILDDAKAADA